MNTTTLDKKSTQNGDTVVIPRKEYEHLLEFKKIEEFTPTPAQKRALVQAENNFRLKKTLSYDELVQKLGFTY